MCHLNKRRFLFFLGSVCLLFLVQPVSAQFCECFGRLTVLDDYRSSDTVVIVRVTAVEKKSEKETAPGDTIRSTTVKIEKVFKGSVSVGDKLVFRQGKLNDWNDCAWTFEERNIGNEYLFYLDAPNKPAELWEVLNCGRSKPLSEAFDDLLYLEHLNKVRGKTRISGTYGDWEDSDFDGAGRKIRIIGKKTYETKTDLHGVYELYAVPPGKYVLEPELPAGRRIDPDSVIRSPGFLMNMPRVTGQRIPFTLRPGKHAGIDFSLTVDNAVSGSIHDSNGKPMPEVDAVLVPITAKNAHEQIGGRENTDKNGRFEITSIEPGSYVLVLNEDGIRTSREPFDTIYYPNVSQREKATVITIAAGQFLRNKNIVVPAVETITVRGVLRYSDNKPVAHEWVEFKAAKVGNVEGSVITKSNARGRFSMEIIKGLKGEFESDFSSSSARYEECTGLPRASGKKYEVIKSTANKIEAEHSLYNVVLRFPFSACRRKQ